MQSNGVVWGSSLVLGLTLIIACAVTAWAQGSSSISGRILDNAGASIPDTKVTVKDLETEETRVTTTAPDGSYRLLALPVGNYEVKAEKDGFKASVRSGIDLEVGQEAVINVTLEVGSLTQEVTVNEEAPVVNTTTAETSGLVNEQQVKDLPLNGRSFDQLITLNAGTLDYTSMHSTSSQITGGLGNLFSVAGRRVDGNLFLLNGVIYGGIASIASSPGSVSGELLGIDAVREFNVLSENYGAEYGKKYGGQISIVTSGGTNQIHGTAFDFLRNSDLDARNFFDLGYLSGGPRLPHFERNNFGASLGGPIRKDKTFLFGNYEGIRETLGLSNVAIVPDNNTRNGFLPCGSPSTSGFTCNTATNLVHVGLAPGIAPFMGEWPVANGPEVGGGAAKFFNSPPETIREDFGTTRFDQIVSDKDTFSGVYTIDNGISLTPVVTDTFNTQLNYRAQVLSLSEVHIFSPSFLNTFTAGFSRATYALVGISLTVPNNLSVVELRPPPAITIGSIGVTGGTISAGGSATGVSGGTRNLFTETDNVQITKGIHLISFGVWFERVQHQDNPGEAGGTATFTNLSTFLQGQLSLFSASPYPDLFGLRQLEAAWYVEDTIRIRPNLTVTAGLRHEFTNGWNEAHGRLSEFIPNFVTGILETQPRIGSSALITNNGIKLFGPRLGVAWDVFGNGKTAVHAGSGIYYNLLDDLAFDSDRNPPFNQSIQLTAPTTFPLATTVTPQNITTLPGALPAPISLSPYIKTPTMISYNLKVEQQLASTLALSVDYSGSHGSHLPLLYDANTAFPVICGSTAGNCTNVTSLVAGQPNTISLPNGTKYFPAGSPRRNPALGTSREVNSIADSNYNALLVELNERLQHGIAFKANYTWSKSLDDQSSYVTYANTPSTVLDPDNPMLDYGPSSFDIRNRFSFTGRYDLPFGKGKAFWQNPGRFADKVVSGWQVDAIVNVQSGIYFTPQLGFSQSRNQSTAIPDRPSLSPNFSGPLYLKDPNEWFNPAAFVLPALGTYGNSARNSLVGPGLESVNLTLFKDTAISERFKLETRADVFNVLNRANFGLPNPIVLTSSGTASPTAGEVTSTATTSRQVQIALKLIW